MTAAFARTLTSANVNDPDTPPTSTLPHALFVSPPEPRRRPTLVTVVLAMLGTLAVAALVFAVAYTLTGSPAPAVNGDALAPADVTTPTVKASATPRPTTSREAGDQPHPGASPQASVGPSLTTNASATATNSGAFSVIVDNTTSGRFTASANWSTSNTSTQRYGANYRSVGPIHESDPAWYKVNIPSTGTYQIQAWYPANSGYNSATPYVIVTTSGNKTVTVDQRVKGGAWVTLGMFTLAAGDRNVVGVSRWSAASGPVVADAIRVSRN
jgi:hypothetical protein